MLYTMWEYTLWLSCGLDLSKLNKTWYSCSVWILFIFLIFITIRASWNSYLPMALRISGHSSPIITAVYAYANINFTKASDKT